MTVATDQPQAADKEILRRLYDEAEKGVTTRNEADTGFDEALEKAGNWGVWQKKFFVIASFSQIFTALHCVAAVFLSATPEHWCKVPVEDEFQAIVNSHEFKNISIPRHDSQYAQCEYFLHDYTTLLPFLDHVQQLPLEELPAFPGGRSFSQNTTTCDEWLFDDSLFSSTVVSEWSLVCHRRWMGATVQSSYMAGLLVGSLFFGQISDRFGRRTTSVASAFISCIVAMVTAFVESYAAFLALRFVIAAVGAGLMVTNFVLVMELVKPEARSVTGMLYAIPFGLGIAVLPGIAYFARDWRTLQFIIGAASSVLLLYYWLLPESPRWLCAKGRPAEALKVLKIVAKGNRRNLPSDEVMTQLIVRKLKNAEEAEDKSCACLEMAKDQSHLVRTPVMRRRCLICFFLWFVGSMVYYGLTFSGSNLNADPFLMVFASGIVEIPSYVIVVCMLNRIGRRFTTCFLFSVCGLACLVILFVPREYIMVNFILANMGKFFNASVFQLCYLYTSELVPTPVRNIAVGTSSMFARVGSSSAPFIVDLLGAVHYTIPSTVFGILSLLAGVSALLLPETGKKPLPETVDEVEDMSK